MTDKHSLLDKVYDAFEPQDWEYGKDNLNPVREIRISSVESLDSLKEKALGKIANRVAILKKALENDGIQIDPINDADEEFNVQSIFGNGSIPDVSDGEVKAKMMMGGPLVGDANYPWLPELIERLVTSIGDVDPNDLPGPGPYPNFEPFGVVDILPSSINSGCAGDILTKLLEAADYAASQSDSAMAASEDAKNQLNALKAQAQAQAGDDNDVADNIAASVQQAIANQETANKQAQDALKACALAELDIAKIILVIAKVVSKINEVIAVANAILVMTAAVVQLAAQCWNNPTCIAKILADLTAQITAVILGIVSDIIQALWDSLNLNCITEGAQSVVSACKEALAGVKDIVAELDTSAVSILDEVTNDIGKSLKELGQSCKDIWTTKGAGEEYWNKVGGAIKEKMAAEFGSDGSKALDELLSPASGAIDLVKDIYNSEHNNDMVSSWNNMMDAMSSDTFSGTVKAAKRLSATFDEIDFGTGNK